MKRFIRKSLGFLQRDAVLISLLVSISLISQALFRRPPSFSDQMAYYRAAVAFPHLPEFPNHWTMRLGLVIPVGVLYRIFGHSELTYYAVPFISAAVIIVCTYLIGSTLFNKQVGFFSALWITWQPYFLLESGNLLPDMTASACLCLAITLLVCNRNYQIPGKFKWVSLAAGALFGWAYLTKEYFAFFAIIVPLIFWLFKIKYKYLLFFTAGVLAIIGIEFILHAIAYGESFIRFTISEPRETSGYIERDVFKIVSMLFMRLSKYNGWGTIIFSGIGLSWLTITSVRKSKESQFIFAWFGMVYGLFTLLALLPVFLKWDDRVLLRIHNFRYWIPILPALFIGITAALDNFTRSMIPAEHLKIGISKNQFAALSIGALLVLSSMLQISAVNKLTKFVRKDSAHFLELREYLIENNGADEIMWMLQDHQYGYDLIFPIYSHNIIGKSIWHGQIKYLNTEYEVLTTDQLPSGKILIDHVRYKPGADNIPEYLINPPDSWRLDFESSNGRIAIYAIE